MAARNTTRLTNGGFCQAADNRHGVSHEKGHGGCLACIYHMIEHVPGHVGHTPRPQPHGMLHPVAVSCEPQIKLFQPHRKLHHKQFSLCAQLQGASVEHRPQNGQHSQKLHAAYDADGHMVPFSLYRNPHTVGQEPG